VDDGLRRDEIAKYLKDMNSAVVMVGVLENLVAQLSMRAKDSDLRQRDIERTQCDFEKQVVQSLADMTIRHERHAANQSAEIAGLKAQIAFLENAVSPLQSAILNENADSDRNSKANTRTRKPLDGREDAI